jgi:hypothetical protein
MKKRAFETLDLSKEDFINLFKKIDEASKKRIYVSPLLPEDAAGLY